MKPEEWGGGICTGSVPIGKWNCVNNSVLKATGRSLRLRFPVCHSLLLSVLNVLQNGVFYCVVIFEEQKPDSDNSTYLPCNLALHTLVFQHMEMIAVFRFQSMELTTTLKRAEEVN